MSNIGSAIFLIVFFLVSVIPFVLWVITLVDAVKTPDPVWEAAGQNKLLWVLLIILASCIGMILYWFIPRPALKAAGGETGTTPGAPSI